MGNMIAAKYMSTHIYIYIYMYIYLYIYILCGGPVGPEMKRVVTVSSAHRPSAKEGGWTHQSQGDPTFLFALAPVCCPWLTGLRTQNQPQTTSRRAPGVVAHNSRQNPSKEPGVVGHNSEPKPSTQTRHNKSYVWFGVSVVVSLASGPRRNNSYVWLRVSQAVDCIITLCAVKRF